MPLSVPLEMLLMLIMFNLVGEASIRVPSLTGSTLGTVSGLILGQAAVEAKLVHPLLIIVVAVSSLGSYAVPDYSLGLAVRIGQLPPACGGQHLRRLRHRAVHDGALRPPVQPDEPWRTLRRPAFAAACA